MNLESVESQRAGCNRKRSSWALGDGSNEVTDAGRYLRRCISSVSIATKAAPAKMSESPQEPKSMIPAGSRQSDEPTASLSTWSSPYETGLQVDKKTEATPVPRPDECAADMDPDTYLKIIVQASIGVEPKVKPALSVSTDFFPAPTQAQVASYSCEIVGVVRENQLDDLRTMHERGSTNLRCCNRFGESLIHMASRRGFADMVHFLIHEADVSIRVRDDCGRTPFHDACWNQEPQFDVMATLIEQEPLLLFLSDKRGNTPFNYARKDHWGQWRQFLYARREKLCPDADMVKKYLCH